MAIEASENPYHAWTIRGDTMGRQQEGNHEQRSRTQRDVPDVVFTGTDFAAMLRMVSRHGRAQTNSRSEHGKPKRKRRLISQIFCPNLRGQKKNGYESFSFGFCCSCSLRRWFCCPSVHVTVGYVTLTITRLLLFTGWVGWV